ncbi:MAG: DUF4292 domain-containing protein [Bacteroidales bacterium]|nr:DUF4292 domain-containing protein [Bacteroidales bacterium]
MNKIVSGHKSSVISYQLSVNVKLPIANQNNRRSFYFLTFIFLLLSFIFVSCKSTRHVIKEPIKEYGAGFLFEKLKENELQFDWFSAKYKLDLVIDKKKTSFNGQIRMHKDSVLWISFSPVLGIEMARLFITTDSVKFINRINKTYFLGDYQFVSDFLDANVDFDIIQSILLGNDVTYYEDGKFRATYDSKEYHLVTAGRRKLKKYVKTQQDEERIFIQNIFLNPDTYKITNMKIKEVKKENKKLEASYFDFNKVAGQLFPHHITYDIVADKPVKIELDYSKIAIDNTLSFPFKISSKYTQIH